MRHTFKSFTIINDEIRVGQIGLDLEDIFVTTTCLNDEFQEEDYLGPKVNLILYPNPDTGESFCFIVEGVVEEIESLIKESNDSKLQEDKEFVSLCNK